METWQKVCTDVADYDVTPSDRVSPEAEASIEAMRRACPVGTETYVDEAATAAMFAIETFRPVMQAKNPHWDVTPPVDEYCGLPRPSPVSHLEPTATIVLTNNDVTTHISLVIHVDGELSLPPLFSTSEYVSWLPGRGPSGEKRRLGGFGEGDWSTTEITEMLTLYGGNSSAMLLEWDRIKSSGEAFDVIRYLT
jgi:hypothetical protein